MKASLFLAATGAVLAMAGPVAKRHVETEVVVQIVTVTVTAGTEPTAPVFVDAPVVENPVVEETTSSTRRHGRPSTRTRRPRPTTSSSSTSVTQPTTTTIRTTHIEPAPAPEPTVVQPEPEPQPEPEQPEEPTSSSSAPAPPASTQPASNDYEGVMLEQHNIHRRNHSASDLVWDETLAQYAANTANGCVFAHDMSQGGGGYGQNLASWGSSGDISELQIQSGAAGVTMQWYNGEVEAWQFYGEENPPASSDLHAWGHFTQVVWAGSQKLGCATVSCPAGTALGLPSWYTVCNYEPAGNFGGQYGENVLPPNGAPIVTV